MIKFEHTVFALPFALIGALLAARGVPNGLHLLWIVLAMVSARSAAMTFNRIVDLKYDIKNPRTRLWALPAGQLTMGFAILFTIAMSALFVVTAGMLNQLCFYLSLPVLVTLFGYSYTKRFTSFSHLVLGFAIGLSPLGAWLAIRGEFGLLPVLLSFTVMFWIAAFDIIYSCKDAEFDRTENLFSMPSRWGIATALKVSSGLHIGTVLLLILIAQIGALGVITYFGIGIVAAILYWEHQIVRPDDLSRVDVAFFNLNGYVSMLLLVAIGTDILIT